MSTFLLVAVQLSLNLLAVHGGRPYVDRRLWRAANESDLSWFGSSTVTQTKGGDFGTVGRKERTACPNDAGRVAAKIEQYIFSKEVRRPTAPRRVEGPLADGGRDA